MFGRSLKKSLVLSAAALSLCVGTAASADVGLSFSFFDINNCDRYDSGASFQTTTFTSYAPVTTTAVSYGSTYSYFGGYRPYTSFTYGYTPVYQPVVYYNDPVVYYPPPVYVETYYAPVYYRPVYRTSYTYFDTCYPSYGFSSYQGSYSSYSSFSFGLSFTFGNYYGGHRGGRYGRSYYDCYDPCRPIYCPPAYTCQPEQYFRPRGGQLYDSNGGGRVDSGDGFADGQFAPSNARDRREVGRGNGGTEGVMGASQFDQSRSNAKPGFAANARGGSKTPVSIMGTDYPTPDGTAVRDYVHIVDLADAHILTLRYLMAGGASDIFNLGAGRGCSVREVIQTTERLSGKAGISRDAPRRAGDPPFLVADCRKAASALGWRPTRSDLDTIVGSALDWHRTYAARNGTAAPAPIEA